MNLKDLGFNQDSRTRINKMNLKINLHINEACNYSCRHCFSKFGKEKEMPFEKWRVIIEKIIQYDPSVSFNIAGGEPFLYSQLDLLIDFIYSKGCELSIITNGSLMSDEWILQNAKKFDMIGFSVDSFNHNLNKQIGRSYNDKTLSFFDLSRKIEKIKQTNVDCKIKINTVVTSLNKNEKIAEQIMNLNVDRFKILKMKEFKYGKYNNKELSITNEEFKNFVANNHIPDQIIDQDMTNSYYVVNPQGFLLDNSDESYKKIGNLYDESIQKVFSRFNLNKDLYQKRYSK